MIGFAYFKKHCASTFCVSLIEKLPEQARTQTTSPGRAGDRNVLDFPFIDGALSN